MSLQSSLPLERRKDIGDGYFAIPVSSPILKLHDDLFWSIFNWNANMAEDKSIFLSEPRALTTTHQSSQVCQRWRRIILYASSLWGNLLDLDMLSMGNDEWRDEILRRTGVSLLSVRSTLRPLAGSKSSREFFYSLFEKNWDRIRTLYISQNLINLVFDGYAKLDETRWSRILSSPAKNMESFRFLVNPQAFPPDSSPILKSNSAGLFNNSAPMLTEFEISTIHCSTTFFPHLRAFSADSVFGFDVGQFLDALRHMNLLESLKLTHFLVSPSKQRIDSESTSVLLPRLMDIHLEGPLDCATLLDNIQPAVGCTFKLVITDESPKESELMRTAYRVVFWYAQSYCMTYPTSSLSVNLSDFSVTIIAIPYNGCKSSQFTIPLPKSDAGVYEYLLLLNSFPISAFPLITHLRLDVPYQYEAFCFKSLLSSFSSVEELKCTEQTLEKLDRISATEHFFPQLKILKLTRLNYHHNLFAPAGANEPLDECELPPFFKFLSKRWENERPIEILDLNRDYISHPRILRLLDRFSGLKLTCSFFS
jgi:hypothetical protein